MITLFPGCLVRLMKRWENKQFDGRVASFSRLKLLQGERGKEYRLRVTWYERVGAGFQPVASIDSTTSFSIGAHQPNSKRTSDPGVSSRTSAKQQQRATSFLQSQESVPQPQKLRQMDQLTHTPLAGFPPPFVGVPTKIAPQQFVYPPLVESNQMLQMCDGFERYDLAPAQLYGSAPSMGFYSPLHSVDALIDPFEL